MDNKNIAQFDGSLLASTNSGLSNEQMQKLSEMMNSPQYQNYAANQMKEQLYENLVLNKKPNLPRNQMVTQQEKLNTLVGQLESKLTSIQYENMKLNAQIETLNKTIDSDAEKLDELKTANANLKTVNQTLIDSNKHYWRNTFFISLMVGIISFILGMYTNEIKSLFLSLLNILK